jgi:hypothetical protein
VIAGLLRPVWTWALWNWRRLGLTLSGLAVLTLAVAQLAHAPASPGPVHAPPGRSRASAAPRPAGATPTARASSQVGPASPPGATPGPGGSGLGAALLTGEQFAAAWVSHAPGWKRQARRYATPALATRLTAAARSRWHPAAVTGPAAAAGEQAPGTITVTVPTTAGVALITVVRSAGGWLVSTARFAGAGH